MNIKERGVTVGDLVIIVLIFTTIYLVKYFNNDKKTNFKLDHPRTLIVKITQLFEKGNSIDFPLQTLSSIISVLALLTGQLL